MILSEYDGKKHFIRHLLTPDHTVKNDCLIRALVEVTGNSYYNICRKLGIPYIANRNQHSIPSYIEGVTVSSYEKAFSHLILYIVKFATDCFSWHSILNDMNAGKLPTVKNFTKTYSRRKQFKDKKLILHCFSLENKIYHAVYCKNGYYYDSNDHDNWYVVYFDVFK